MSFDLDLLRSFAVVADSGGISRAATRLRLSQPTVSLQLKRLEDHLGCRLLLRSRQGQRLTPEGETLLSYSRRILGLVEEMRRDLAAPAVAGSARLGTPEDFATKHLPGVLASFAQAHPRVALEVTTDLTLNLIERFRTGEFDLVLVKREPLGPAEGVRVWRESLVWAALEPSWFARSEPLPLVVSPHPCVYRKRAIRALEAMGRSWRIAYSSTSLAGTHAAVRAGLGVTVVPKDMVPGDLTILDEAAGAPDLAETEIALMTASSLTAPAQLLAQHIMRSLEHTDDERR